jgi:hypothetical protein
VSGAAGHLCTACGSLNRSGGQQQWGESRQSRCICTLADTAPDADAAAASSTTRIAVAAVRQQASGTEHSSHIILALAARGSSTTAAAFPTADRSSCSSLGPTSNAAR